MEHYIIMCRSLSYAQRGERILEKAGITAYIIKAPQGVTPEGCSYGLRVSRSRGRGAIELLKKSGIRLGKVFRQGMGEQFREVEL